MSAAEDDEQSRHSERASTLQTGLTVAYSTVYVLAPNGRIWRSDGEQPDALLRHELKLAGVRS